MEEPISQMVSQAENRISQMVSQAENRISQMVIQSEETRVPVPSVVNTGFLSVQLFVTLAVSLLLFCNPCDPYGADQEKDRGIGNFLICDSLTGKIKKSISRRVRSNFEEVKDMKEQIMQESSTQAGKEIEERIGQGWVTRAIKDMVTQAGKEIEERIGQELVPGAIKDMVTQAGKEIEEHIGQELVPGAIKDMVTQAGKEIEERIVQELVPQAIKKMEEFIFKWLVALRGKKLEYGNGEVVIIGAKSGTTVAGNLLLNQWKSAGLSAEGEVAAGVASVEALEADWKQEGKRLREEVKQLRSLVEEKDEKIREMEVGMMEKNSEKEWELMGTKLLVEQMKEERARRDEAVEKWKKLYLEIKTELDELIQRTYDGDGLYWKAEENDIQMENLRKELQEKEEREKIMDLIMQGGSGGKLQLEPPVMQHLPLHFLLVVHRSL
ncbi:unnamed protein product [Sphenostylis stenocarpa]|uniref:Uncharacterized protein n=1 Tax=Sphenostylis stenocarpa TaxID=92480 RepID=A0AA86VTJ8_9FABA|nr:unnamed protein product [Sphenostylis stenocarpa]